MLVAMGSITVLLGGARSGKSSLAVELGRRAAGAVTMIVTAEPFDDDLAARIARHRLERPAWPVIEAPLDLAAAVGSAPPDDLLIVDCLTVWAGNCLHHGVAIDAEGLLAALGARPGPAVLVSNEVGMGIVPESDLAREYRDRLGRLNQAVAAAAQRTLLLVAGRAVELNDPLTMIEEQRR